MQPDRFEIKCEIMICDAAKWNFWRVTYVGGVRNLIFISAVVWSIVDAVRGRVESIEMGLRLYVYHEYCLSVSQHSLCRYEAKHWLVWQNIQIFDWNVRLLTWSPMFYIMFVSCCRCFIGKLLPLCNMPYQPYKVLHSRKSTKLWSLNCSSELWRAFSYLQLSTHTISSKKRMDRIRLKWMKEKCVQQGKMNYTHDNTYYKTHSTLCIV